MKAIVIGSGIVGLCTAYYLTEEGYEVDIIENENLSGICSTGNLGMIVPSHFIPLASPGIISKGVKWLLNAKSPFYIRPSLNKNLLEWGWKFIKYANAENCRRSALPLMSFNVLSRELYAAMQTDIAIDFGYQHMGLIMYYNSEEGGKEERHIAGIAKDMGLDVEILSNEALQLLEPNVALNVKGGVYYKCDAHLHPNVLQQQLRSYLSKKAVRFHSNKGVSGFCVDRNKITGCNCGDKELSADIFVLAAGSWLPGLAQKLKVHIPVIAGKGYTFDSINKPSLNIPCILTEARVAITPFGKTIRFGGTMEIGTMNNKINMNRVQGITDSVNEYFTNVDLALPAKENVWYGYRPCSPDGLPYLGKLTSYPNVIIAGGHSMMGLSLGAATGKLVSELAMDKKTSIDISLFNAERFN